MLLSRLTIRQRLMLLVGVLLGLLALNGAVGTAAVAYLAYTDHQTNTRLDGIVNAQLGVFNTIDEAQWHPPEEGYVPLQKKLTQQLDDVLAQLDAGQMRLPVFEALVAKEKAYVSNEEDLAFNNETLRAFRAQFSQAMDQLKAHQWQQKQTLLMQLFVAGGLSFVLIITLSLAAAWNAIRYISSSLKTINTELEFLSSGDADLTRRLDASRADEIGLISENVNATIEKTFALVMGMKAVMTQVDASGRGIGESSSQIRHVFDQQQNSMEEIKVAVQDTTSQIQEINDMAHKSKAVTQSINVELEESSRVMQALLHNSQKIGDVVKVIDDISDQVNLLALNAAIEAARAGDAGLGFAVVADEVRKLASNTSESTEEITRVIQGLQSEVNNSLNATNKIVGSIEDMNGHVDKVSEAVETQSGTLEEISSTVNMFSEQMVGLFGRLEDVNTTVDVLLQEVQLLSDMVAKFKTEV